MDKHTMHVNVNYILTLHMYITYYNLKITFSPCLFIVQGEKHTQ